MKKIAATTNMLLESTDGCIQMMHTTDTGRQTLEVRDGIPRREQRSTSEAPPLQVCLRKLKKVLAADLILLKHFGDFRTVVRQLAGPTCHFRHR